MKWYLDWEYPLLLDDRGIVIAKDNGDNEGVIPIDDELNVKDFIQKCNDWWNELMEELDEIDDE